MVCTCTVSYGKRRQNISGDLGLLPLNQVAP